MEGDGPYHPERVVVAAIVVPFPHRTRILELSREKILWETQRRLGWTRIRVQVQVAVQAPGRTRALTLALAEVQATRAAASPAARPYSPLPESLRCASSSASSITFMIAHALQLLTPLTRPHLASLLELREHLRELVVELG